MAKNSIDAYGAAGKSNLLFFTPESLHLVTDPQHALYDSRVHMPVDEAMVLNIMHQGIVQPIVVTKNTETGNTEVVAGRQRVKCAREANIRLLAQGAEPIRVPAMVKGGTASALAGAMVSENEIRTPDTPIGRAEKMQKLIERGTSEADICTLFGCVPATVHSSLALLNCCIAVQNAVQDGKVNVGHAVKLSTLPVEEQREKLAELLASGEGLTGHAKARAQRAVVEGEKVRTKPNKKEIAAKVEQILSTAALTDETKGYVNALQWVLGNVSTPPVMSQSPAANNEQQAA